MYDMPLKGMEKLSVTALSQQLPLRDILWIALLVSKADLKSRLQYCEP